MITGNIDFRHILRQITTLWTLMKEISISKTILFNIKLLPLQTAFKLPIFISKNVSLIRIQGHVEFECNPRLGIVRIGFNSVPIFDKIYSRSVINLNKESKIVFCGKCRLGSGVKIGSNGRVVFGRDFNITAETIILCEREIIFGSDNLISWNCQIMDCDFHQIEEVAKNVIINAPQRIIFGNNIWLGSRVSVMKGVALPDDTIVAAGSIVVGTFYEKQTIIGGSPVKVLKTGVVRSHKPSKDIQARYSNSPKLY